jgi:NarL family two-component system sensor histidine kinase LiaS
MQQLTRHFAALLGRLQWKLTLSYALTTTITLLIFEVLGILIIGGLLINRYPQLLENDLKKSAEVMKGYPPGAFVYPQRHINLNETLANINKSYQRPYINPGTDVSVSLVVEPGVTALIDPGGRVLATSDVEGKLGVQQGSSIQHYLPSGGMAIFLTALNGHTLANYVTVEGSDEVILAATPVLNKYHKVVAVLLTQQAIPSLGKVLYTMIPLIGPSLILATIMAVLGGCVVGFFVSRWFTSRFQKMQGISARWSRGDFSHFIKDKANDEIGQLSLQLNSMARQLDELLHTRQRIATLEERNRLARDLHDSIKQQLFAISMQIASAQTLIESDVAQTKERLNDVDRLVNQSQQELETLIYQLRPVPLAEKKLVDALREYSERWAGQHKIRVELSFEDEIALPLLAEETFFRIAQEALANVWRHSKATRVLIRLFCEQDEAIMEISDNGKGFHVKDLPKRGIGLYSMQERVEAIGGHFVLKSSPGKGTTIRVAVKLVKSSLIPGSL